MTDWVSSETFSAYAETDLDRWRQLEGRTLVARSSEWGEGLVERVSWGTPGQNVPAFVQLKIRYDDGLVVTANATSFAIHHRRVQVSHEIAAFIEQWFAKDVDSYARETALQVHARKLRERLDQTRLARLDQRRGRSADAGGDSEASR